MNTDIRRLLDIVTEEWGVQVTLVELTDIQLPDSMKRVMARQAEAEREKRAKIINAEGESLAAEALGEASDIMMAHPLALQLRNLQSLVEIRVDQNATVVFPSPLMSTIGELGTYLARETTAAGLPTQLPQPAGPRTAPAPVPNGDRPPRPDGLRPRVVRSRRDGRGAGTGASPVPEPHLHSGRARPPRRPALLTRKQWPDRPGGVADRDGASGQPRLGAVVPSTGG